LTAGLQLGRAAARQAIATIPQTTGEKDTVAKKRKREDLDESDPKLAEYLQVMKTGGEMLNARSDIPDSQDQDLANGFKAQEAESDDEYENVPSRAQKRQMKEKPSQALLNRETESAEETTPPEPTQEPASQSQEEQANLGVSTTDDDWLRSRTNRLLDLVDPEELETPRGGLESTTAKDVPSQEPVIELELNETAEESHNNKDIQSDPKSQPDAEVETEDTEGIIRRTARLFVRNLPYTTTEDDLRRRFSKFGELEEVCDILRSLHFFPLTCLNWPSMMKPTKIGTAYTFRYMMRPLEQYFSRCFDF
jgi:multiple RNA-binding domain-containing protein 1